MERLIEESCSLLELSHPNTQQLPAYYRLGVFNILKLSRNLEEELQFEHEQTQTNIQAKIYLLIETLNRM